MKTNIRRFLSLSALLLGAASSHVASADDQKLTLAGRAKQYENLSQNSLEATRTQDSMLKLLKAANAAPTALWTMLEHGEKVECLGCIPYVSKMLYASNPKTREISAWWLRRRIFGVFGPGEAYEQTVTTLSTSQNATQRAYAANALGEFLEGAGIAPVAKALTDDQAPEVRLAAANALVRLNTQGPNAELGTALADGDVNVRLAALYGVTHINVFSNVDRVVARISDDSPLVRRRAAQTLGALKTADSVVGLIAITSKDNEPDAGVRAAAVWALGQIADPEAREAVVAAQDDSDVTVRNAAAIAVLRL
jgi:HEAT repeat protein